MTSANPPRALPRHVWSALVHPWTWRMAWRDSRTQRSRLILFSLAVIVGVAALTAIHSLNASVQTGLAKQAKALLGSDLQISSRQAFSEADIAQVRPRAQRLSRETSFSSMLYFPGADAARLVQVRGIEGEYPYYGKVETTPADAWTRLRGESGIVLEPALLEQFGAKVGDRVKLGSREMPILGVITAPAPRSSRFSGFAPEAYVNLTELSQTGLLGATSLAFHHLHLELPLQGEKNAKRDFQRDFSQTTWRFETPEDRRETLGNALDNLQQFLGLIAVAALVLGAIGVAGAVHAHLERRVAVVAILRCLGCPGNLAFSIYFVQALALGFAGAVVGAAVGVGLHLGILTAFHDLLPVAVSPQPEWLVVAKTSLTGMAVCCGFALLPLSRVGRISPAATLRDGASLGEGRTRVGTWLVYLLLAGLLAGLALLNAPNPKRALGMVVGLAIAFGLLAVVARGLMAAARRTVRSSWPYLLRQGVSNLYRPHNQTLLFLLSLGLGTFLILTILLAGNLLTKRLTLRQFAETPNIYLVDVQPDQVPGVSALVEAEGLPVLEKAPMVTMRITELRGVPVRELEKKGEVPKWVLRREFRSTYRASLNATETIVAGEFSPRLPEGSASMPEGSGPVPLSLEAELAKDLRVALGDEIVLDVQGVPVKARVTSFRKVDWGRFNLNFFMVFPPGVLEDAPGFHVLTTRVPADGSSGALQRSLAKSFPNVSAIDLTAILDTVRGILTKISRVVSVLGAVTVLAALPILAGTLLHGRDARRRESVLLRTLGASARQVRAILIIEYTTLGTLSALTGTVLAVGANVALATFVFKAPPWPDPMLLVAAIGVASAVAVAGGLLLSRGVTSHSPLAILRENA